MVIDQSITRQTYQMANGVNVTILNKQRIFGGIADVTMGDVALRSGRLPIMPYLETPDGFVASEFVIHDLMADPTAIVIRLHPCWTSMAMMRWMQHAYHPRANTADWAASPVEDPTTFLTITIKPVNEVRGDTDFSGLSYGFSYTSSSKRIYTLIDRATWELGGHAQGNTVYQPCAQSAIVRLEEGVPYQTGWTLPGIQNPFIFSFLPLYTHMQGFTFQHDDNGYLVTLHEHPMYIRTVLEKLPHADELIHMNQFGFDLTEKISLPARKILYAAKPSPAEHERHNDYLRIRDDVAQEVRRYYDIQPDWAQPYGQLFTWHAEPKVENFIDYGVDALARAGVRHVMLMTLWETDMSERLFPEGNCCCILDLEISQHFGGEAYMKRLSKAVHERDMLVGMWLGQCLSARSPYVSSHPDWFVRDVTGQIDRDHYGFAQAVLDESSEGVHEWLLGRLRYAHESLGLDGLYRDSHFNQGTDKFNWHASVTGAFGGATLDNLEAQSRAGYQPTEGMITTVHDAEIAIQRSCQDLGYFYAVESSGIFGIHWGGANYRAVYQHEFLFSNMTRPFPIEFMESMGLDWRDVLFRCLANRICYGVTYDPNRGDTGTLYFDEFQQYPLDVYADGLEVFGEMNRAFLAVEADMHHLQLLPGMAGTIWENSARDVRVIWAYDTVEIALQDGETVDGILGPVYIEDGRLRCQARGVYRISSEHARSKGAHASQVMAAI